MNYDWNFWRLLPYWRAFAIGTCTTVALVGLVIVIGTALGVVIGFGLRNRWMRICLYPLVDLIRALPPLVLILFMYYLLTVQVIGTAVQAFWVCVIAMSLNLAAFTADLVRASVERVPRGIIDAGRSLGMSQAQIRRHVVLPQVARDALPGMTVLYVGMLKVSSLASVINVRDVVFTAQTVVADISRSLEAWIIVALVYIALVVPATYLARGLERWSRRGFQVLSEGRV